MGSKYPDRPEDIKALYRYFGADEQLSLNYLEQAAFELEHFEFKTINALCKITNSGGYTLECLGNLMEDLVQRRVWLSDLTLEEKEVLVSFYAKELGQTHKIETLRQGPGNPLRVSFYLPHQQVLTVEFDNDGEKVSARTVPLHWC